MDVIQECQQVTSWLTIEVASSADDTSYTVTIPPTEQDADTVCTCPSFAFRGYCRHIDAAFADICGWRQDQSDVEQTIEEAKKRVCPVCGGPTNIVILGGR